MECTVHTILQIFKETQLKCNLRILGSQLGLSIQDLDDLEKKRDQLAQLLDTCLQRGLLADWEQLVATLKKPALERYGRETVLRIESEQCRRGSSTSVQSEILSPISVTSDSHPLETSLSLEMPTEDGKLLCKFSPSYYDECQHPSIFETQR